MKIPIMILCVAISMSALAQQKEFLIVGKPSSPFKISGDPNHPKPGISIEILSQIMKELEIPFRFQLVESVGRIEKEAKIGRADMLISFSKNPERQSYLSYPKQYYRFVNWNFFIRKEDAGKIKFQELQDLSPYLIGITEGVSYTKEFWDAEPYLKLYPVALEQLLLPMLIRNRIDVVPLSTQSALKMIKSEGLQDKVVYLKKPLKSKPYYDPVTLRSSYFTPPEGSSLTRDQMAKAFTARIDAIISTLIETGFVRTIYEKYDLEYIEF